MKGLFDEKKKRRGKEEKPVVQVPPVETREWWQEPVGSRKWVLGWISSDCKERKCVDGMIYFDYAGYSTASRCPRCNRAKMLYAHGYPSTLAVYQGTADLRSDEEMNRRMSERREIAQNEDYRWERVKEVMAGVGKIFDDSQIRGRSI